MIYMSKKKFFFSFDKIYIIKLGFCLGFFFFFLYVFI